MKALQLNDFLNYQYLSALDFAPNGKHAVFAVSRLIWRKINTAAICGFIKKTAANFPS